LTNKRVHYASSIYEDDILSSFHAENDQKTTHRHQKRAIDVSYYIYIEVNIYEKCVIEVKTVRH